MERGRLIWLAFRFLFFLFFFLSERRSTSTRSAALRRAPAGDQQGLPVVGRRARWCCWGRRGVPWRRCWSWCDGARGWWGGRYGSIPRRRCRRTRCARGRLPPGRWFGSAVGGVLPKCRATTPANAPCPATSPYFSFQKNTLPPLANAFNKPLSSYRRVISMELTRRDHRNMRKPGEECFCEGIVRICSGWDDGMISLPLIIIGMGQKESRSALKEGWH